MVTRLCYVRISCSAGCDTAWQVEEGPCFLCTVSGHSSDSGRMLWIQAVKHIRFDAGDSLRHHGSSFSLSPTLSPEIFYHARLEVFLCLCLLPDFPHCLRMNCKFLTHRTRKEGPLELGPSPMEQPPGPRPAPCALCCSVKGEIL